MTRPASESSVPRPERTGAPRRRLGPELALRGLHLAVLSALGIAQPLFTDLNDGQLLVVLDFGPSEIILLALAAIVGPPAALLALEAVAQLASPRLARWLHLCFVAGLASIVAFQLIVAEWAPPERVRAVAAVLAGVAFAVGYARAQPIRSIVTVLAPVPVVFACLFLFFSPVQKLAIADQGDPPSQPVKLPNPVVLIVLDEMNGTALMDASGRIDEARFPNFAHLARRSTWFRNATTVNALTEYAVPGIVSGRRARFGALATAANHRHNLFALLRGNPMTVHETFTDLCPRSVCPPSASAREALDLAARTSLRQWLPGPLAERVSPITGDDPPGPVAARFVASLRRQDEPGLHYLHLLAPHAPWSYLPSGKRHSKWGLASGVLGLGAGDRWTREGWPVVEIQQAFMLQAMYTDRLLGDILNRLEETGLYDRSLVLVMADHGVSFHPGEWRRDVSRDNFEDILSVPFFVKAPGQERARVSDDFVRTIDAVPTIVDVLGLRSPWRWEGQSVRAPRHDSDPSLDIQGVYGDRFAFRASAFVQRRDAARRAQAARFGTGESDLYRIGPHAGLLGRLPGTKRAAEGVGAELADGVRPVYDSRSELVPVRVVGTIVGPRARNVDEIAVALNGRIAGTTRTFLQADTPSFNVILPESRMRRGPNTVSLYEISRGPRLARIPAR
jgi:Sulfatase